MNNPSPRAPYTNWDSAATGLQDAVDAAAAGDTVLVTNGVYQTGGKIVYGTSVTNRVALTKPLTLQSVNGPDVTVIKGNRMSTADASPTRCAYLTNGAVLSGFTLTNGGTGLQGDLQREQSGGGVWGTSVSAVVSNCIIAGNYAQNCGSGAYSNTLFNCVISNNSIYAFGVGGAVYNATLYNCSVSGNTGGLSGGGAYQGTLFNSVLQSNVVSAGSGAGAYKATLYGCTIIGNRSSPPNVTGGGTYQCTLSNCTITGNATSVSGGGAYSGTLYSCTLSNNYAGSLGGGAYYATLYNCRLLSNSAYTDGGGAYGGALTNCTLLGNRGQAGGGSYDATVDTCMVISNTGCGAYFQIPGSVNNSLVMGNSAAGVSCAGNRTSFAVNDCTLLFNAGAGAAACMLSNCLVATNSRTGAYGCVLTRCVVAGNTSPPSTSGGGASSSILTNCVLLGNLSTLNGGGVESSTLINCTLVGNNSASFGGGANNSTLYNSIVYNNTANPASNGSNTFNCTLGFSCTSPVATGAGNFTNAPMFVDLPAGNLRLQTGSPCLNAGNNSYMVGPTDLDGRPRVVGGAVDVGAYEFQDAGMGEFIAWLQGYGLPTDGLADYFDSDNDGLNNWEEWRAGTIPTNAFSVLKTLSPSRDSSGLTVSWQSVAGKTYILQRCTNFLSAPLFFPVESNIVGQDGATTTYLDKSATNDGPYFYRVGLQP